MADPPQYCRHCGVQLRRLFGSWRHVARLGPVACARPEPEPTGDRSG